MYAGGPLLNLRLLGLFIFETEILLKLLCQQLYFTDFLRALQLKSTFKYYDRYIHIPNVSTELLFDCVTSNSRLYYQYFCPGLALEGARIGI